MPSSHSINRLFVFVDYANKLSPTLKSFMFASARSDCPDFLFEILIEEGQRIISMLMSTRYRTYQDAFIARKIRNFYYLHKSLKRQFFESRRNPSNYLKN